MSMEMMVRALQVRVGNPTRKLILLKLADNANDAGECWPSYQHIADQCEVSRRSVIHHVAALCSAGLITRKHRNQPDKTHTNASNLYILRLSPMSDADIDPPTSFPSKSGADSTPASKSTATANEPPDTVSQADSEEIDEYVHLAERHGGPEKCRNPRGLRRYLRRHGLTDDHRAEMVEWRAADEAARGLQETIAAAEADDHPDHPPEPPQEWVAAREHLRCRVPDGEYHLWIEPLRAKTHNGELLILADNKEWAARVRDRYGDLIRASIEAAGGGEYSITAAPL
ncbi:helix-turn-helix domain-containing protein [Desulfurivibrio alkaliphilus]|uniref:DnaA N-terminal domain-containing protein n=1 Tax=Desulfurivibrio alkaliphilus (strain DSM 19089 / UNIQEM U267 / AHT2) TaxID=589865 RepID=D6Z681_DESAT|nr:helix-turn-helix domain-containing protein [Desulfurivibrio alkaliphilus]ADH86846.1 hypothetical protein DaAHT2_2178 [Desulfurivibrio alkaliphilus AHT 2]